MFKMALRDLCSGFLRFCFPVIYIPLSLLVPLCSPEILSTEKRILIGKMDFINVARIWNGSFSVTDNHHELGKEEPRLVF